MQNAIWRAFWAKNGRKSAPVLEFDFLFASEGK